MPVPDNSDPLYVSVGNMSLRPEFQNRFRLRYSYTDLESYSTYSVMGGFNFTKDDIINASWYDATGTQYTVPVNSDRPTLGRKHYDYDQFAVRQIRVLPDYIYTWLCDQLAFLYR